LHVGRSDRKASHHVFGRPTLTYFFFEVGECLRKEKGRDYGIEEIIQPIGLIEAETLKGGLVENEVRPGRHV
jgi:hypothetical protein